MLHIVLINGPNLNLLGLREPHIYGSQTLSSLESACAAHATAHSLTLSAHQSNHEGALVDIIHAARGTADGIVINAGAYTHTSVAIRDALIGVEIPFVEVHLSNIHKREQFRHKSYLSDKAEGVVCGLGGLGYLVAIEYLGNKLKKQMEETTE